MVYPPGAVLRKVSTIDDIHWKNYRVKAGHGLAGQYVRVEERDEGADADAGHFIRLHRQGDATGQGPDALKKTDQPPATPTPGPHQPRTPLS